MRLDPRSRVHVREAVVADAHGIAEVVVASWLAGYAELMPADLLAGLSVSARQRQLAAALGSPKPSGAVRLVAVQHGAVIGFANGGVLPEAEGRTAELAVLHVAPEYWHQGVGRKLVRHALRGLAAADCVEVQAWVVRGNVRGVDFLLRQGWEKSGARRAEELDGHTLQQQRLDFRLVDSR